MISSITKELELKETRQELETHRQEHSDQQQVSVVWVLITFFDSSLLTNLTVLVVPPQAVHGGSFISFSLSPVVLISCANIGIFHFLHVA